MSTAARPQYSVADALADATRNRPNARRAEKPEAGRFADIAANPFYQVVFDANAAPDAKKEALAKLLTYAGTREENRERIRAFETFKEYLQEVREQMAQEIIQLTDTETFAELQKVYKDLNSNLLDFNDRMAPLTEIVDAIYKLRTNNLTLDAFKEIAEDRQREKELEEYIATREARADVLEAEVTAAQKDIALLGEQKSLFGFGPVNRKAREQIALQNLAIQEKMAELEKLNTEIKTVERDHETKLGEFAAEKAKLRELLDISTEEHRERQTALVESALRFVRDAKERIGSVREHLGGMNQQVENLLDANGNMVAVYAVMNEAIKDAGRQNQELRATLVEPAPNEDTIAQMTRDQKRMAVEGHITQLDTSAVDTMSTYGDLTSQTVRIRTMKEANDTQITKARNMHSQGIAGVADRLSVVLQSVSAAALGESSAMAGQTLNAMTENTNAIAQKEAIRIAMGVTDRNAELQKAVDDLATYGEVVRTATNISREGLVEMQENLDELRRLAEGVRSDIKESIAVNAEVGLGVRRTGQPASDKPANPFNLGGV